MMQPPDHVPELRFYMMRSLTILRADVDLVPALNKKEQALLCYLKVNGRSCSRRELETVLWPDSPKPKVSLRVALNHLRNLYLDEFLDISDEAIAFNQQNHWSDVDAFTFQFEHLLANNEADLSALMHLIDQSGDTFLPGFSVVGSTLFEEWKHRQRLQVRQQWIRVLEWLAQHCWESGDLICVRRYAERLVRCAPWHKHGQAYLARLNGREDAEHPNRAAVDAPPVYKQYQPASSSVWDDIVPVQQETPLTPSESAALLCFHWGRDNVPESDEQVAALCRLVDFNPLALALIGRFLRERPFTSLPILIQQLEAIRLHLPATEAEYGLRIALAACFAGLKPSLRELMQHIHTRQNRPFTAADVAQIVKQPLHLVQDDLDYLVRLALLHNADGRHYVQPAAISANKWPSYE
ncbi:MAG: hypothetical protein KC419_15350 [Anaerolineales bacterium]|nr:hypothetical protein [Anaerolineales bacterium]